MSFTRILTGNFAAALLALNLSGCTSNLEEFSGIVDTEDKVDLGETAKAKMVTELVPYEFTNQKINAQWFSCSAGAKEYALLINMDARAFGENLCTTPVAQAFLQNKINVVAFNRPGYGKSVGKDDFSGPLTQYALTETFPKFVEKVAPDEKLAFVWAQGSGTIAAGFFSKGKTLKKLILASGVYDVERTALDTTDAGIKKRLEDMKAVEAEEGYEVRSLAWDFSDLPKTIFLYHGNSDTTFPASQASAFRDGLATQEYSVDLVLVKNKKHNLTPSDHFQILTRVLQEPKK
ncbi:MAG: alpha/beta hydrolase family protein [Oligoflexales bacterium]